MSKHAFTGTPFHKRLRRMLPDLGVDRHQFIAGNGHHRLRLWVGERSKEIVVPGTPRSESTALKGIRARIAGIVEELKGS